MVKSERSLVSSMKSENSAIYLDLLRMSITIISFNSTMKSTIGIVEKILNFNCSNDK